MYTANSKDKKFEIDFAPQSNTQGTINGLPFALDIVPMGPSSLHLLKDHQSFIIDILEADYQQKTFTFKIKGCKYTVSMKDSLDTLLDKLGMEANPATRHNQLKAPMPGLVVGIHVELGQEVQPGDKLLVLEAMKMENNLVASSAGKVSSIKVRKGQAVEKNQLLIEFE